MRLRTSPVYTNREWQTYTGMDLGVQEHLGVHCINDGGYHRWKATMNAEAGTLPLENAGRVHEGVRKDSECTCGIMKRRHRVLKVPSLLSTSQQMDKCSEHALFCTTCCSNLMHLTL
mmetsp:Transcript_26540/g.74588  ORF Transcript_26540/g.74588 Transcript_26540/m.74588 type:complete len:117 (+) Transcript_26540:51-401(+)